MVNIISTLSIFEYRFSLIRPPTNEEIEQLNIEHALQWLSFDMHFTILTLDFIDMHTIVLHSQFPVRQFTMHGLCYNNNNNNYNIIFEEMVQSLHTFNWIEELNSNCISKLVLLFNQFHHWHHSHTEFRPFAVTMSISILARNNQTVCFGFIRSDIFTSLHKGNVHCYWCRNFWNKNNGQAIERCIPFGNNPILFYVSLLFHRMLSCRFSVLRVRNQRMHSIWVKSMHFQTERKFLYCCFHKEHTIILMVSYVIWCIREIANNDA